LGQPEDQKEMTATYYKKLNNKKSTKSTRLFKETKTLSLKGFPYSESKPIKRKKLSTSLPY
jgi:hypothetical protein